ncbi:MAG: hypothetical protein AAFZ18_15750 [Myxococcota bacterium]
MRSWFGGTPQAEVQEAMLELAVLTLLAAERWDEVARDRLGRALARPPFAGPTWAEVEAVASRLADEAPLFTEARDRVEAKLRAHAHAEAAIALAARLVGDQAADADFLLADVAERLEVELPDARPPLPGFERARFDDPGDPDDLPFETALGLAESGERRLLMHKLVATRHVLARLGAWARVAELGRRLPHEGLVLRADAVLESDRGRHLCRFLAPGEALHATERRVLPSLVASLRPDERWLLAHGQPLSPVDETFLATLPEDTTEIIEL